MQNNSENSLADIQQFSAPGGFLNDTPVVSHKPRQKFNKSVLVLKICRVRGNHLIFSNCKKAYGTRGYEVKTPIIKERRNPPLAMHSPSGMEPTSRYPTNQESSTLNPRTTTNKNRGRRHASNPNPKENEPQQAQVPRRIVYVPPFNREVEV
jgi:hypothetical protein